MNKSEVGSSPTRELTLVQGRKDNIRGTSELNGTSYFNSLGRKYRFLSFNVLWMFDGRSLSYYLLPVSMSLLYYLHFHRLSSLSEKKKKKKKKVFLLLSFWIRSSRPYWSTKPIFPGVMLGQRQLYK